MKQVFLHCIDNRLFHLWIRMSDVCNQNTRGPVEPNVSERIINLEILCFVPQNRGLAEHRPRFVSLKSFERWHGCKRRQLGDDTPKSRADLWDSSRLERKKFGTQNLIPDKK